MIEKSNETGFVSVIVPVYKVEKYLDQCVDSIVNQDYEHMEIILVDDGSPDRCPQMCDDWVKRDHRVQVIHRQNGGLSAARNSGIDIAKGEYILFVDSDDWLAPDLLSSVMNEICKTSSDVCVFGYKMIDDETNIVLSEKKMLSEVISGTNAVEKLLTEEIDNYAWNKLYRRELFQQIRYPEGFLWEDLGTTYKIFLACHKVSVMENGYYYYRQRAGTITSDIKVKGLQDIFVQRLNQYKELKKVKDVNHELGFAQLVENAFLYYNRTVTEPGDPEQMRLVKAFLKRYENRIVQLPVMKVFGLYYKNRRLYNMKIRLRAVGKKILRG